MTTTPPTGSNDTAREWLEDGWMEGFFYVIMIHFNILLNTNNVSPFHTYLHLNQFRNQSFLCDLILLQTLGPKRLELQPETCPSSGVSVVDAGFWLDGLVS